ncbi:hypothetical protein J6590_008853 [Homalodisca vitripennis]|nr:hypothetical protein J6590_008853 [Homalodisca vitripennis]
MAVALSRNLSERTSLSHAVFILYRPSKLVKQCHNRRSRYEAECLCRHAVSCRNVDYNFNGVSVINKAISLISLTFADGWLDLLDKITSTRRSWSHDQSHVVPDVPTFAQLETHVTSKTCFGGKPSTSKVVRCRGKVNCDVGYYVLGRTAVSRHVPLAHPRRVSTTPSLVSLVLSD